MTYVSMKQDDAQAIQRQNGSRSLLHDRAVLSLYAVTAVVAMGGWLWFLGRLSWYLVSRAVSALG
ncbi:MAG: hypothetical protein WCA28_13680 [Bradyrhizobium sp.]